MSLEELHQLAVGSPIFKNSLRRSALMKNLWLIVAILQHQGIPAEIWVDGSFLTEKLEPEDVDLVILTAPNFVDAMSPEQEATLTWLEGRDCAKQTLHLDAFLVPKSDGSDGQLETYFQNRNYWKRQFGRSRSGVPKGMSCLTIEVSEK